MSLAGSRTNGPLEGRGARSGLFEKARSKDLQRTLGNLSDYPKFGGQRPNSQHLGTGPRKVGAENSDDQLQLVEANCAIVDADWCSDHAQSRRAILVTMRCSPA